MTEQEQDDFLSGREELRERERLQREADAQPGAGPEAEERNRRRNRLSQPLACEQPIVDRRTLWQRLRPWLDWR